VLLKALIAALPYSGTIRWAPNTVMGYVPQKLDIERDLPLSGRNFLTADADSVDPRILGASNEEFEAHSHGKSLVRWAVESVGAA